MCQGVNVAARVTFGKGTVLSVLPGEQGHVLESGIASFLSCSGLFGGAQFWEAVFAALPLPRCPLDFGFPLAPLPSALLQH